MYINTNFMVEHVLWEADRVYRYDLYGRTCSVGCRSCISIRTVWSNMFYGRQIVYINTNFMVEHVLWEADRVYRYELYGRTCSVGGRSCIYIRTLWSNMFCGRQIVYINTNFMVEHVLWEADHVYKYELYGRTCSMGGRSCI